MKLTYLKLALKCDSFDVAIDIKIQFFRVLVTIEPGRSLLQFVTTNCLTKSQLQTSYSTFISLLNMDYLKNGLKRLNTNPDFYTNPDIKH